MNKKSAASFIPAALAMTAVLLSSGCFLYAGETENVSEVIPESSLQTKVLPEAGVTFEIPEEFDRAQGSFAYDGAELNYGDGVYLAAVWYYPMSQEELDGYIAMSYPDDEAQERLEAQMPLAYVFGIDADRTEDDLLAYISMLGITAEALEELGSVDTYHYYMLPLDEFITQEDAEETLGEYAGEYMTMLSDHALIADHVSFEKPSDRYDFLKEYTLDFETSDLDGNPVSGPEIFADHKITMVNCWTSWCGFCIDEMPLLQEMSKSLEEKDCALISILYDGDDEAAVRTAKQILADSSADFPVLLPWDGLPGMLPVEGYPTTFFVDSSGRIIGRPVIGARTDRYEPALDALLETLGE